MPVIGEKVKIVLDDDNALGVGTVTRIFPANKYQSGRFVVAFRTKYQERAVEFCMDDYGKSVIPVGNN